MTQNDYDITTPLPQKILDDIEADFGISYGGQDISAADVIASNAGIGYGGHFDETSDDENAIIWMLGTALGINGEWLLEIRFLYSDLLRNVIEAA